MTSRMIVTQNGERKEQELNELASMIKDFCKRSLYPVNVAELSEYAEGYNQALNTIENIINGLPAAIVAK